MQIIVVQSGLYVTAVATYYYNRHTYIYALNLLKSIYVATAAMYTCTCMHALQLNYTVEATDEGRHDTTRGGHSSRGPH
jgi:hypothetical protein